MVNAGWECGREFVGVFPVNQYIHSQQRPPTAGIFSQAETRGSASLDPGYRASPPQTSPCETS